MDEASLSGTRWPVPYSMCGVELSHLTTEVPLSTPRRISDARPQYRRDIEVYPVPLGNLSQKCVYSC